ncbi:hypothetical protein BC938DRAFT_473941, partial [Jimgerdemannia flammicorona]
MIIQSLLIYLFASSSSTPKCVSLCGEFEVLCPEMPTTDFDADITQQENAIATFKPDCVIGSSYGGNIAITMLHRGTWRGPTILLAAAFVKNGLDDPEIWLPKDVPITLIHGTRDNVVDIRGSRLLATKGTLGLVRLIEVNDVHKLPTLVGSDIFFNAIKEVVAAGQTSMGHSEGAKAVNILGPGIYVIIEYSGLSDIVKFADGRKLNTFETTSNDPLVSFKKDSNVTHMWFPISVAAAKTSCQKIRDSRRRIRFMKSHMSSGGSGRSPAAKLHPTFTHEIGYCLDPW